MAYFPRNLTESTDRRGVPKHLTSHFDENTSYFNKLLKKDFSMPATILTIQDKERIKEAYEKAHHIREYEISLYWSRLNYLWTITAVLFAGWGVILSGMITPEKDLSVSDLQFFTLFVISIFGVLLIMLSSFITKAGKHWQQVWEYHVTVLEPFQSGSLYSLRFINGKKSSPSISRAVGLFHIFLLIMWLASALFSATLPFFKDDIIFIRVEITVALVILGLYFWINNYVSKSSDADINLAP